jgi:hypothetical protein
MKRSALFLPALALAVSLVATGCGGSSDNSSDGGDAPAASISKADFTEQANTICSDASDDLQTAGADITDQSTQDELVAFVTDAAIPSFQAQHDAIADLADGSSPFADANAAANGLGLTDCGS